MYIYQSLATSILYTIKFLNILTSPSMCKQEDYFKKWIYMHNKNIFSCHASTGRPKPCRALGWGTTERSRFTSLTENSCSNQQSASAAKQKAIPMRFIVGSIFPLEIKIWFNLVCSPCSYWWVGGGENEVIVTVKRSGRRSQVLKCTRSKKKNYNIQSIPLHTAHTSVLKS